MFGRVEVFHVESLSKYELLNSEKTLIRVSINAFWCILLCLEFNDRVVLSS